MNSKWKKTINRYVMLRAIQTPSNGIRDEAITAPLSSPGFSATLLGSGTKLGPGESVSEGPSPAAQLNSWSPMPRSGTRSTPCILRRCAQSEVVVPEYPI